MASRTGSPAVVESCRPPSPAVMREPPFAAKEHDAVTTGQDQSASGPPFDAATRARIERAYALPGAGPSAAAWDDLLSRAAALGPAPGRA